MNKKIWWLVWKIFSFIWCLDSTLNSSYYFSFSHNSETGLCAKAKLESSEVVWTKTECGDTSTKGVVCGRRFNWEDIGML